MRPAQRYVFAAYVLVEIAVTVDVPFIRSIGPSYGTTYVQRQRIAFINRVRTIGVGLNDIGPYFNGTDIDDSIDNPRSDATLVGRQSDIDGFQVSPSIDSGTSNLWKPRRRWTAVILQWSEQRIDAHLISVDTV
nr:hypothetical protein [Crateriforma conspicua]